MNTIDITETGTGLFYAVVDKIDGHIWYISKAFHKAYNFWLNKKGCSLELI